MASFRMILRPPNGNPSDAFDVVDDFSTDTIASGKWVYESAGGTGFSITGGQLVPTTNADKMLYRQGQQFGDVEVIEKVILGAAPASTVAGPSCRRNGDRNFLWASLDGANVLRIYRSATGINTALANTVVVGPTPAGDAYWLLIRAKGNVITAEYWRIDPLQGGSPAASCTATLTGNDAAVHGNGMVGECGTRHYAGTPIDTRYDDWRVHPLEVDLAPFTRVAPGDGLDPANAGYLEPAFAEAPLRDGGPLVNVDSKNREVQIPVSISATSKDSLRAKQTAINRALQEPGVQLEWRDDGETRSSFLDVQAGRMDEDYNFRRSQKFWGNATVHIWTTPFAHTNNTRVIGTLSGSGAVQGMPVEPIGNDPSNMVSSGDFELGVLGLGSWAVTGPGLAAGGSIMQLQSIPTYGPAYVGDYVMRVWADGTIINEGFRVPLPPSSTGSAAASAIDAMLRIRTPRVGSYPIRIELLDNAGGAVGAAGALSIGTAWTTASVVLSNVGASISGSWSLLVQTRATDIASITFEVDQAMVTPNGFPSLSVPSVLDGDVAAKAVWQVTAGSQVQNSAAQIGRYIGVAAIPASYVWQIPAASLIASSVNGIGTYWGASGAQGSQFFSPPTYSALGTSPAIHGIKVVLPNAAAYAGRNRVYAIARSHTEPQAAMWLADWEGNRVGPTAIASGWHDWHLYDLGAMNVPTSAIPSQIALTIYGSRRSLQADDIMNFDNVYTLNNVPAAPTSPFAGDFAINEVIILPEQNHALLTDDVDMPSQIAYDSFYDGGPVNAIAGLAAHTSDSGHTWASGYTMAGGTVTLSNLRAGVIAMPGLPAASIAMRMASIARSTFRVQTNFEIASVDTASTMWGLRKDMSTQAYFAVKVAPSWTGGPFIAIESATAAAPVLLASMALPTLPVRNGMRLVAEFRSDSVVGYLLDQNSNNPTALLGSVMASGMPSVGAVGDPGFYTQRGSQAVGLIADWSIYDFRVESIPTQRIAPRDVYVLDGVAGEAYRRPQSGDVQQRLTHKLRGQIPAVPVPSTARLVAFALGLPEGVANDVTDLQVSIREQFRFAR